MIVYLLKLHQAIVHVLVLNLQHLMNAHKIVNLKQYNEHHHNKNQNNHHQNDQYIFEYFHVLVHHQHHDFHKHILMELMDLIQQKLLLYHSLVLFEMVLRL